MTRILLGNLLSLASSVMLWFSSSTQNKRRCYLYQAAECMILLMSQAAFGKPSAVIVMFIALLRNLFIYFGVYNPSLLAIVFVFTGILGTAFNSDGLVGLIPTITAMIYSISSYVAKSFVSVKGAMSVNLITWVIYSFLIYDFAAVVINFTALVLNLYSVMCYYKKISDDNEH